MTDGRNLAGKVVWVTGASRGLGKAMALALGRAGAHVAISARSAEALQDAAAELEAEGVSTSAHPLSVSDAPAVSRAVSDIVASTGALDGLINCAGISPSFDRSEHLGDDAWAEILQANLTGTFYCCREAGAHMLDVGSGGSIVNISSVHASSGFERIAAYAASKGGVEALTRTLAVEWAARGIRVNTLAPGYFTTELSQPLLDSHWSARVVGRVPQGRIGDPRELGGAAVYLISDASTYTTGSTLTVDGGWSAW